MACIKDQLGEKTPSDMVRRSEQTRPSATEALFLAVVPLNISEGSIAVPTLPWLFLMPDGSFQDRFNVTRMGKEWDLPGEKPEHSSDLKVQEVSMTKN